MKRLADFLAHHNSVPIALGFLFLAGGTALAASPSARDALIGGVVTEMVGVDNSAITDADLGHFNANMTITAVTEDAQNYYVAYRYQTFSVDGAAWKEIQKDGALTIAKSAVQEGDLKAYAIEQLRQVVESDLVYLKRVQAAEIASGRSESQVATSYHGLAGLAIEMKDILLPPAPAPAPADVAPVTPAPETTATPDAFLIPVATTTAQMQEPEAATTATVVAPEATTTATTTAPTPAPEATTTDSTATIPEATTTQLIADEVLQSASTTTDIQS